MISKKMATAVGAGAVAGALGVSLAGGAFTASASPATGAAKTTSAAAKAHPRANRFGQLSRVIHGEGVVKTRTGYQTLAVDRGTVTAVSPTTVTITSADKVVETFTVVPSSHVRVDGRKSSLSAVRTGELAGTVAVVNGSTKDVKLLIVRPAPATAPVTPTS